MDANNQPPITPPLVPIDPELPEEDPIVSGQGGANKQPSGLRDFGSFIGILGIAALLAFLLISFVFRSYAVDGPSMQSALQNEDKLIIWKVPRTIARLTGHQYVPNRGDVIIFSEDNLSACGQDGTRQLIKRVIGLPGERVAVKDGKYVVYNKAEPGGFDPDQIGAYDKQHQIATTTGSIDVTLGENQLFVSGDNRPDSCDSRAFGPISTDKVIGKLVLRLLPANKITVY